MSGPSAEPRFLDRYTVDYMKIRRLLTLISKVSKRKLFFFYLFRTVKGSSAVGIHSG